MSLNEIILIIFYFGILIYSIILHEVAHGVVALMLGDPTAKYSGRLSANPIKHIDPWLTIGMPLIMLFMTAGRFAFGAAKPVPYNPYNLSNQKWGPAMVALGGPLSNIIIALLAAIIAKIIPLSLSIKRDIIMNFNNWEEVLRNISGSFSSIAFELLIIIIFWNVFLAFFNLIPIPPLDGSKLLFAIFPVKIETVAIMEQFGFVILLFFLIFFSGPLGVFLIHMLNIFLKITL